MTISHFGKLTFDSSTGLYHLDGRLLSTDEIAALILASTAEPSTEPKQSIFDFPVEVAEADLLPLSPDDTLREAHRRTMALVIAGKHICCPCCEREGEMRPRKIHREMARAIGYLARHSETSKSEWHHLRAFLPDNARAIKASSDISFFVHWKAVARNPRNLGEYKILDIGKKWVLGEMPLARLAWVYNNQHYHFSKETVMYKDAVAENLELDLGNGDVDNDHE